MTSTRAVARVDVISFYVISFSFYTSPLRILEPGFVDVDSLTWNMNTFIRQRRQHKNTNTKALTYLDNTKHIYKIDRRQDYRKQQNS